MSRVYFAIMLIFFLHISLICAILFSKAVEHMTVGEKIKKIRTFRGMTQKELGLAIGFEEKGADNRIAQYETNYRVPKRELLDKIAQALRVDRQNFYTVQPGCAEDFMRTFFWLHEERTGPIRLFQLVCTPGKIGA